MTSNLGELPWAFWLASLLLLILVGDAISNWKLCWSKPALVVYVTVAAWYLGDALYNGIGNYRMEFTDATISFGFLQVCGFLLAYRMFLVPLTRYWLERPGLKKVAGVLPPPMVKKLIVSMVALWSALFVLGVAMSGWQLLAIIWPPSYTGDKIGLFVRPGVGGDTSFLVSTAAYTYLPLCGAFAVFLVLGPAPHRWYMIPLMVLAWPYYLFDRARNVMLALLLPGFIAYLLLARDFWVRKAIIGFALFVAVAFWFTLVMEYRVDYDMQDFVKKKHLSGNETGEVEGYGRQYGLNMLEELCWMDSLIDDHTYHITYGRSYLDDVSNVIPRAIWKNKPMIGIDYAIARGMGGADYGAGVFATISEGMIGNGVSNFGKIFGVVSSAFLMAAWSGFLARLWIQRANLARALLFLTGLGLTFNLGRDITLLVLWPFVFGYILVRLWESYILPDPKGKVGGRRAPVPIRGAGPEPHPSVKVGTPRGV